LGLGLVWDWLGIGFLLTYNWFRTNFEMAWKWLGTKIWELANLDQLETLFENQNSFRFASE